ncbi:pyridoxamine 5'-phosphate oxidase family protein [Spirillospora sp. NPDC048911]|uniref:pyridoxamine 5'-phosphate oxidase family protein n=1 Tax=Spirillospora sp. NPDC048911 TaxID=3364527 RepID=UPI003724AC2B
MRTPTTVADIDAIIGTPSRMVLLKATGVLDEGCRAVLAAAPVAALGIRDATGASRTMLVGGTAGFAHAESRTRLSLGMPDGAPIPALGTGVSMVFLLPGLGETFRLNGTAADVGDGRLAIDMTEAYVHCARCVLRAKLWTVVPDSPARSLPAAPAEGPLSTPGVCAFLAASPFAVISSRDGDERADTSPRGDGPGFLRVLDGATIAVPDRRGNKRADTLHNLMTCADVSLAALVPGRGEVAYLSGTAQVSTDPTLLATMALRDKPPHAAIVVHVQHADLAPTTTTHALWSGPRDPERLPDLNAIAAEHLASNTDGGRATRLLSRGLATAPKALTRRAMDAAYRSALRDEGYRPSAFRADDHP